MNSRYGIERGRVTDEAAGLKDSYAHADRLTIYRGLFGRDPDR
jgi:hypothetical protein